MGESKRRAERKTPKEKLADQVSRELASQGKLIEGGWAALRVMFVPADAAERQVADMRLAYMAGAQHLWSSIMATLDPGTDETPADVVRMLKIEAELAAWAAEMARDHYPTRGSA